VVFIFFHFLDTMQDTHEWVHARQLKVNMRVSGLFTPTCNGDRFSEARHNRGWSKHDVTEVIMTLVKPRANTVH